MGVRKCSLFYGGSGVDGDGCGENWRGWHGGYEEEAAGGGDGGEGSGGDIIDEGAVHRGHHRAGRRGVEANGIFW